MTGVQTCALPIYQYIDAYSERLEFIDKFIDVEKPWKSYCIIKKRLEREISKKGWSKDDLDIIILINSMIDEVDNVYSGNHTKDLHKMIIDLSMKIDNIENLLSGDDFKIEYTNIFGNFRNHPITIKNIKSWFLTLNHNIDKKFQLLFALLILVLIVIILT